MFKKWYKIVKNDFKEGLRKWIALHGKHRHLCSLEELEKQIKHSKLLSISIAFWLVLITCKLVDLFFIGKTSLPLLFVVIMLGMAIYDEQQNVNNLRLFVYFKYHDGDFIVRGVDTYGRK